MSALPEPLTSPEDDVRDLDSFMLNVERLLASELVALGNPEECWAALMLWCRAWKQIPGGSLPDDDKILAAFSGAGRRWPKVRDMALRGFLKCSDGRLYHRVLCEEVKRASAFKARARNKRETDAERLRQWREKRAGNGDDTHFETRFVAEGTGQDRTGQDKRKKDISELRSQRARAREGDFEAWWEAYPHKVGKRLAERAYQSALARAGPDELAAGVLRYIASKPPDRQWCNPTTWLNENRWLDQPAPEVVNGNGHDRNLSERIVPRNPPSQALLQRGIPVAD